MTAGQTDACSCSAAAAAEEVELTAQQLKQLERLLDEFQAGGHDGAVIPLLQRTQDLLGYLSRPALRLISKKTLIPLSRLYGVATFYAQFRLKRRGRHLVRVCDGTACHVRGAGKSIEALGKSLGIEPGATTPDYKLTLEIVYCLGSCGLSPVALVDDKVYGRLQPDELVGRLSELQ